MTTMQKQPAMTDRNAMTDANPYGRYAELLGDLPDVARGEQERLGGLLDEIAAWVAQEESACYRVAVYTGRVRGPLAFEAIKHTRHRREGRVMRLLPTKERRARRLETDDRVLVVAVRARTCVNPSADEDKRKYRYAKRDTLFRRAA